MPEAGGLFDQDYNLIKRLQMVYDAFDEADRLEQEKQSRKAQRK